MCVLGHALQIFFTLNLKLKGGVEPLSEGLTLREWVRWHRRSQVYFRLDYFSQWDQFFEKFAVKGISHCMQDVYAPKGALMVIDHHTPLITKIRVLEG